MRCVTGTYNGTGAAVYLCLGFIPDELYLLACEDSDLAEAAWYRNARATEIDNGVTLVTGTTYRQIAALTAGTGIEPYEGGDVLTSANQTSTAYGEGVYLGYDDNTNYQADLSYGVNAALTSWTLGSSGNRTGNCNDDTISGSRIGEGSRIIVRENDGVVREAIVEAWTAGQGVSANEVTLSRALKTGTIEFIGGMYSMVPVAIGKTTKAGVKINNTTLVNVNDEIQFFRAVQHDVVM